MAADGSLSYAVASLQRLALNFKAAEEEAGGAFTVTFYNNADSVGSFTVSDAPADFTAYHVEFDGAYNALSVYGGTAFIEKVTLTGNPTVTKITFTASGKAIDIDDLLVKEIPAGVVTFENVASDTPANNITFGGSKLSDSCSGARTYTDHAYQSGMAMRISDTSGSATSSMKVPAGFAKRYMTVDFDLYVQSEATSGGGANFKILSGAHDNAHTAFWFRFFQGKVIYYTGSAWITLSNAPAVSVGKWAHIRIEADAAGSAKVYVNDTFSFICPHTTYGTSAKETLNGFFAMSGGSTVVNDIYFLDNLYIREGTADSPEMGVSQDFEALTTGAAVNTTGFASSSSMTTVSDTRGANGSSKSAFVNDTSNTSAACMQINTNISNRLLDIRFDLYLHEGTAYLKIMSGNHSNGNTAYWLRIKSGALGYYNGSAYVDVGTASATATWMNVHILADADVNGLAYVYINDVFSGSIPHLTGTYGGNAKTTLSTLYFLSGGSTALDKFYVDNLKVQTIPLTAKVTDTVTDFDAMTLGNAPTGFTAANAVVSRKRNLCALVAAGGSFGETVTETQRMTLDFDALAETGGTFTVNFKNADTVVGSYTADTVGTTYDSYHVEFDGTGNQLLVLKNGALLGQTALTGSPTVTSYEIVANTAAVHVDELLSQNGLHPLTADFEDGELGKALNNYTDVCNSSSMAVISGDQSYWSNKSVRIYDDSSSVAANMQMPSKFSSRYLTADFMLYTEANAAGGAGPTVKILSANNSMGNTAFWFRFDQGKALYYDGSAWTSAASVAFLGKWINVHIEADAQGSADVYVDGKLVMTCPHCTGSYGMTSNTTLSTLYIMSGGTKAVGDKFYVDNVSFYPAIVHPDTAEEPVEITLSDRVSIALNTEPVKHDDGSAWDDVDYINEDYEDGFGWAQIPFTFADSSYDKVYIDYSRHRDIVMDDPIDSVKVYDIDDLKTDIANNVTDLTDKYDYMKTDYDMFLMSMTEIKVGPYTGCYFAQNYIPYFTAKNTASTVSWIVDPATDTWTKVEGTLTLDDEYFNITAPLTNSTWFPICFSKGIEILDDGTILHTMYRKDLAIMVQSTDWGKTWTFRSIVAENTTNDVGADGAKLGFYEPSLQRCSDGSLLSVIRTGNSLPLYQTRSFDDGLTWSEYELLPGIGNVCVGSIYPQSVLLDNGILVLTTGRPNNSILVSLDGSGYEWGYATTTMTPASGESTTGNTSIAKIGANTVLVVGDRGFVQDKEAGIWAREITITRSTVEDPQLNKAYLKTSDTLLRLGKTGSVRVDGVLDTAGNVIDPKTVSVQYYSLNPGVLTVDANGKLSAKAVGEAEVIAAVTVNGITINSNRLSFTVADEEEMATISLEADRWTVPVGGKAFLTATALNAFGEELYAWMTIASNNPSVCIVNSYQVYTYNPGIATLTLTARYHGKTMTVDYLFIVDGDTWETDDYNGKTTLPAAYTASGAGVITNEVQYQGNDTLFVNDDVTNKAINVTRQFDATKAVVVEFDTRIDQLDHMFTFGIGKSGTSPTDESGWLAFATPLKPGYPIRLHSYTGSTWVNVAEGIGAGLGEWFHVRIEAAVDKQAKVYVNGEMIAELYNINDISQLERVRMSTGGTATTGDSYYIANFKVLTYEQETHAYQPETMYTVSAAAPANGTLNVNDKKAAAGDCVTFTVKPKQGYELDRVSVKTTSGKEVTIAEVSAAGECSFVMPAENVTVSASFKAVKVVTNPFTDVKIGDYFYEAVLWAIDNKVTDGVDATHFQPSGKTTRAQMVTFLWRAAGCPTVNAAMKFSDVAEDAYYAEAVRWAVSKGITDGKSATVFAPNEVVTRAQAVTFLYRFAGSPDMKGKTCSFRDVSSDAYYYGAVLWAEGKGITSGTSYNRFSPDDACNRGQVVTFLFNSFTK